MTIVASYDWESDTFMHHGDDGARAAWRAAVAEIADKAQWPECNERVDKAVARVLAGDVELLPDGTAKQAPRGPRASGPGLAGQGTAAGGLCFPSPH